MAHDYDLTDEDQVKLYLSNIETEYSFQCLAEKEPDGCHRLADFVNCIRGDEKHGSALFKKNCDENKFGHSCFKYAGNAMYGKGVEKNPMEAAAYFEKSCEYGFARGCANAGIVYLEGREIQADVDKGLRLLAVACERGRGEACSVLGTASLVGAYGQARDAQQAVSLLEKGCALGSLPSCFNLSRMYRLGDGVLPDNALSQKYKQAAHKIKQSRDGDDSVSNVRLGRIS